MAKTFKFNGNLNIGDGEIKNSAEHVLVGGTNDKTVISNIIGNLASAAITINSPESTANSSISLGSGTEVNSVGGNAIGVMNTVGVKGFYWSAIDFNAKTITLSTNQSKAEWNLPSGATLDWKPYKKGTTIFGVTTGAYEGDTISIVNDAKYTVCSKIMAINGNVITVDSLPFTEINNPTLLLPDDKTIFACYKKEEVNYLNKITNVRWYPRSGVVELGWAGTAFGVENLATGTASFVTGWNNWGAGAFSLIGGRGNIGGYASLVSGYDNDSRGETSFTVGKDNVNLGMKTAVIGKGNGNTALKDSDGNTLVSGTVSANNSIIAGEWNSSVGSNNAIFGKQNNVYEGSGHLISGTKNNVLIHTTGTIYNNNNLIVGNNNSTSGEGHEIVSGLNNTQSGGGYGIIAGSGNTNTAGNQNAIFGRNNTNTDGARNLICGDGNINEGGSGLFISGSNNTNSTGSSNSIISGESNSCGLGSYHAIFGLNNNATRSWALSFRS